MPLGLSLGLMRSRGLKAALDLNLTSGFLDSRVTFSRGSNATLVDATGKIVYAPNNTITNSVGPSALTGTAVATVSGAAPDASNATRLSKTDATTPRYSLWSTSMSSQSNTAYVVSAYFKYDGFNTTVSLEYNVTNNWGISWSATFDITASGITANAPGSCTSGVQAVGDGWFRVWAAFTSTTVTSASNPSILTRITGGSGVSVLTTWGQLEQVTYQTTPSTYVATTGSAYYGPRFDYDPVTLAPKGLLIEEARTNLLTYSEQFDNAAWTKDRVTVTANATAAPDGTSAAEKVVDTAAGNSTYRIYNSLTLSAISYTQTFYAKAAEYSWCYIRIGSAARAWFNLSTGLVGSVEPGLTASMTAVGNGWYRISCTIATATAGAGFGLIGLTTANNVEAYTPTTGGMGIYVYGAQLEAGSFATSYIPTVASTVTRSADVATMTGTNFSSWYNQSEGTFVAEVSLNNAPATATFSLYAVSDNTVSERIFVGTGAGSGGNINALVTDGGVLQAQTVNGSLSTAGVYKYSNTYKLNDFASVANGGAVVTDTSGTVPTVDRFYVGAGALGTAQINGHIRQIAYYNTRLPNAQLQTLTAPSLATTLSLSFTNQAYTVGV